jgi:hypothetical protein
MILNLEKLQKHYVMNMPLINKSLKSSRERLTRLEMTSQGTDGLSRGDPSTFDFDVDSAIDPSTAIQQVWDELQASIEAVGVNVAALSSASGGAGAGTRVTIPGGNGNCPDLDDVVDEFAERISDLEARTSGEGFASGDHVFNGEAAVSDWLVAENVPNAGCFWDLFSVLASMSPHLKRVLHAFPVFTPKTARNLFTSGWVST